jgi:hypothetical protein
MLFLEWIETVGGIWLVMSAVAFFVAGTVLTSRRVSAGREVNSTIRLPNELGAFNARDRQLDHARKAKKKPVPTPLEKAA